MEINEPVLSSKIKIYGPPIDKAVTALQKLAEKLPNIQNGHIASGIIPSGETLMGDFDFVFHWLKKPNEKQLRKLINRIDEALKDLDCRYTITTTMGSTYPYRL
ncbi:MAG: hypothetical protein ACFFD2_23255 [Promethearchaeota archaeon]